jgi:hypothetical protein
MQKEANMKRSQAALEFLTTYTWAFLAILVTVGALYYFGVFDFAKFLPQNCLFTSQFECVDFSFVGDEIRIKLNNNLGEEIDVNSYDVTNGASVPLSCTSPGPITGWNPAEEREFTFSGCSGGGFLPNERVEAKITLVYCAPATTNCPQHVVVGKITAVVG